MATTTTIYPDNDSFLNESSTSTNYGSNNFLKFGWYSGSKLKASVLEFDVSVITQPSDIVSATFNLIQTNSYGSNAQTATVARLNQDYTVGDVSWDEASSGVAWTGGVGGAGNAETTQPTYSMQVGDDSGNQSVDIKELVVDAINKRSGLLRLICYIPNPTGAVGSANFGSVDNPTSGNRPTLVVIVAARKIWVGDINSAIDDTLNWTGGAPSADDIGIFNAGSKPALSGTLRPWKLAIGKGYTGNIGTASSLVNIIMDHCTILAPKAEIYININDSASKTCDLKVVDILGGTFDGDYDIVLSRTRRVIDLMTADVGSIDAHSSRVSFTADDTAATVRVTGASCTLENGAGTLTAAAGSNITLESGSKGDTDIILAGGNIRLNASNVDDITMYSGSITCRNNIGAPIETGDVVIYAGTLDTRTDAATFTTDGITVHGGRIKWDGSQIVAVS